MDEIEFAIEKFGMDPVEPASEPRYYMGWINDPDAANTPEELAELDRVYNKVDRQSLPDFWDSRAKGICFDQGRHLPSILVGPRTF